MLFVAEKSGSGRSPVSSPGRSPAAQQTLADAQAFATHQKAPARRRLRPGGTSLSLLDPVRAYEDYAHLNLVRGDGRGLHLGAAPAWFDEMGTPALVWLAREGIFRAGGQY